MHNDSEGILNQIRSLRTYRQGDRRAPHKPLLLLYAIAQLQRGQRTLPFNDVKSALDPLLAAYAPPVKSRHQPELPYWHLATDGLWEVRDASTLDRQASGFPTMTALRDSAGGFPSSVADKLESDPQLVQNVVKQLLDEHFAPSVHDDLLDAVGLSFDSSPSINEQPSENPVSRRRDPQFRECVLRAYEYRCAFSGFRAALNGTYFGCEAAHVQWHCYDGPDSVANGITLEPTLHKLFDVGAWSLTDDRRILVSTHFTGTDETVSRIREQHGQPLRTPLPGEPLVDLDFIQWHREPELGGIFRQPALPL